LFTMIRSLTTTTIVTVSVVVVVVVVVVAAAAAAAAAAVVVVVLMVVVVVAQYKTQIMSYGIRLKNTYRHTLVNYIYDCCFIHFCMDSFDSVEFLVPAF